MLNFIIFALYLCCGTVLLVVWPLLLHPTLQRRKKIIFSIGAFVLLVPIGFGLYALLGAPQFASL